jgi:cyclophilin family peptidyl-prolyl cis-trans isomerase
MDSTRDRSRSELGARSTSGRTRGVAVLQVGAALVLAVSIACSGQQDKTTEGNTMSGSGEGAIAQIDAFIASQDIDTSSDGWKQKLARPPKATFDDGKTYYWVLDTSQGTMRFKLLPDVAPMHVTSTIYLTKLGFYDDVVFHRVINGFMAQGGDPTGTGRGGPGYTYDGEFSPAVRHDKKGLLSMANAGPGTDGSQFFITFVETPHLDDKHTIFGELVDGEATLDALEARGSRSGRPSEPMQINSATIEVQ